MKKNITFIMLQSLIFVLFIGIELIFSQTLFSFLDTERIGAYEFIKKNSTYDGRDVVIIVLDTGVDMAVEGLRELPDGTRKVIDAQDFSGEGDVYYEQAKLGKDGKETYIEDGNGSRLYGIDKIDLSPDDSLYYIGVLKEERFINSSIPDINQNGQTDDQFAFSVFKKGGEWVVYIDQDGDRNIGDESPVYNYKKLKEYFRFRSNSREESNKLTAFALNIFPEENRVNFHYDGSNHGTHVAGIAAGYKINGQNGLNGIAPGAKIISLKIGDCRLSGGATTSGSMIAAYEYGLAFAKNFGGAVVFNMSFGIGSELEGLADMDLHLDDLLIENPNTIFCLSAGNEGPGISSVGLPAASKYSLTVGALNTIKSARDAYGARLKSDKLFIFSSRGGEVNKPDIVAPGGASSTVPPFSIRDNMWGTSMASPQAAGAVALIMSAALQQNPPLPIKGAVIKKAVMNSATPLKNYLPIEQGRGVINVPTAFRFYQNYSADNVQNPIYSYAISTLSPAYEDEQGSTAYWRFGGYIPDANHKQTFYIDPIFNFDVNQDNRRSFYRAYHLSSTAPWLKLNKKNTYIKGENDAIVEIYFDKSRLKEPGIYNAKITGFQKGGWLSGNRPENQEFELMATAIIPHTFSEKNQYKWQSDKITLKTGDVRRIFFDIPLYASSAVIKLNAGNNKFANIRGYLFDPKGREDSRSIYVHFEKHKLDVIRLSAADLQIGTWELVLYADFRNEETSQVELEIGFSNLQIRPEVISTFEMKNGDLPNGEAFITNKSRSLFSGRVSGEIFGFRKERRIAESGDYIEIPFTVDSNCEKVKFELELPVAVFNRLTDFAINIKDYTNKALQTKGFTYRKLKFEFIPPKSGDYFLELLPAFAKDESQYWTAKLTESYFSFKKTYLSGGSFEAYPEVEKKISFEIDGDIKVAPEGFHVFGELRINSGNHDYQRIIVPIKINSSLSN